MIVVGLYPIEPTSRTQADSSCDDIAVFRNHAQACYSICVRLCICCLVYRLIRSLQWHVLFCVCVVCSVSMPPASKRSKLGELASLRSRIPFISQSALSSILKIAATEGLPAITTRRGVREARDKFVGITTPHGPLHTHINVDSVTIEVQNPFAVFWYACKTTGRGGKTPGINQRLLRGS